MAKVFFSTRCSSKMLGGEGPWIVDRSSTYLLKIFQSPISCRVGFWIFQFTESPSQLLKIRPFANLLLRLFKRVHRFDPYWAWTIDIAWSSFLKDLTKCMLNDNQLTCSIPTELRRLTLTALNVLLLNINSLTGKLPTELGNLRDLAELWLYKNRFMGVLLSQLASLISHLKP